MLTRMPPDPDPTPLAHHERPPAPLTLGPDAVADLGLDHARRALADTAPVRLGPAARLALHCTLGDGAGPAAWQRLRRINDHLAAGSS
ncbi:DUF6177 family protein [Streptomyces sp. NPDC056004]|uniref:DUF6177 family protein n=1 Tax=unclassified Streptomyces TaxID=2593676 RepID=UPI0035D9F9AB